MNRTIKATLAATLLLAGVANAQTPATPGNTTATPSSPAAGSASPTLNSPTSGMGMNNTGTATPALGANSQANPPRSDSASPAAVTTTTEPSRTTQAPVAGANSFTEGQARSRIEDKGFANVTDLKKDDKGVWRGTAMKDGKSTSVALDYQGNIVGQ